MATDARSDIAELEMTKESEYLGATAGDTYYIAPQEPIDVSGLEQEVIDDTSVQSDVHDNGEASSLGRKSGEVTIPVQLAGAVTPITGAVATDPLHDILESAFGAASTSDGSTISGAASTTTNIDVATGEGSNFSVGGFLMVNGEIRAVTAIATDAITVEPALSAAPGDDDVVYGAMWYYSDDGARDTWEIKYNMDFNKGMKQMLGCSLRPELTNLGVGDGKAMVNLMATVGDWENDTSTIGVDNTADTGDDPGVVQMAGDFIIFDGATTITTAPSGFEIGTLLNEARYPDASKENALGAPVLIPNRELTATATVGQGASSDDPVDQFRTWFQAQTALSMIYQVGGVAGDALAIYFPEVRINAEPEIGSVEGLVSISITLKVTIDNAEENFTAPFYLARA